MIKDSSFYNKESTVYSSKRYPQKVTNYTQYFFTQRLELLVKSIKKLSDISGSVCEVGCADGVVIRRIYDEFKDRFSVYNAYDTASQMVKEGKAHNGGRLINFFERNTDVYAPSHSLNLIIEVGVINYTDSSKELALASSALMPSGYFIISLAGKKSLWDLFRKGETGFTDFKTYPEYRSLIGKDFVVVEEIPVGLFIPVIWRFPRIAFFVQQTAEKFVKTFAPELFHEIIFVLKKR